MEFVGINAAVLYKQWNKCSLSAGTVYWQGTWYPIEFWQACKTKYGTDRYINSWESNCSTELVTPACDCMKKDSKHAWCGFCEPYQIRDILIYKV
jgi:hypothetical protein